MDKEDLKGRTKKFALRIIRLVNSMPNSKASYAISNQLIRSGTSVGANYRAVCMAKSKADFISKLAIVIEESDESAFWLELIINSNIVRAELVQPLLEEVKELTAIMIASRETVSKA